MNLNKGISTPIAILIVVILASLIGGVIYWQQSEQAKFVSFSELTSNSQQYNNEVITTEGFYIGAFETSVLSPTIEFSEGGLPQSRAPNRIWIGELGPDVLEQLYSPQNKGPKVIYGKIRITGRFNTGNEFGHLGSYKHLLSDIRQVKVFSWSPPEQAQRNLLCHSLTNEYDKLIDKYKDVKCSNDRDCKRTKSASLGCPSCVNAQIPQNKLEQIASSFNNNECSSIIPITECAAVVFECKCIDNKCRFKR